MNSIIWSIIIIWFILMIFTVFIIRREKYHMDRYNELDKRFNNLAYEHTCLFEGYVKLSKGEKR